MNLDDWHLVFVLVCITLLITISAPVVMAYIKINEEQFFVLAVLGEDGMVENYYPDNDPDINVGEEIHWTIYLHNHMGETKYVVVKVKLLSSTMIAPNSTLCSPSPESAIFEVRRVLMDNETWLYPLNWYLLDVEFSNEIASIKSMMINENPYQIDVETMHGYNFRIILELWIYDEISESFNFGWVAKQEPHSAWNQIWFNVTLAE